MTLLGSVTVECETGPGHEDSMLCKTTSLFSDSGLGSMSFHVAYLLLFL